MISLSYSVLFVFIYLNTKKITLLPTHFCSNLGKHRQALRAHMIPTIIIFPSIPFIHYSMHVRLLTYDNPQYFLNEPFIGGKCK